MKILKEKSKFQFRTCHLPITTAVVLLQPAFPGPKSRKFGLRFKSIYTISEHTALYMAIDCTVLNYRPPTISRLATLTAPKTSALSWAVIPVICETNGLPLPQNFYPKEELSQYGLDGQGSILGRGRRFFLFPRRPDRLWSPPCLIYNGHRGAIFQG
jgi:hypothetical protein